MKGLLSIAVVAFSSVAFAQTAQYFRFTPTEYVKPDESKYNLALSEIELYAADGSRVAWPAGTTVSSDSTASGSYSSLSALADGVHDQKCIIYTGTIKYPYVMISAPAPLTFSSYGWWSSSYSGGDSARISTGWTLEISDDGTNWTMMDRRSGYPGFERCINNISEYRGPFYPLVELTIEEGETYTLDAEKAAALKGADITLKGTLDLNGFDLTLQTVDNLHHETPSVYLTNSQIAKLDGPKIVNGSATPAKLTVGKMTYAGAITETAGRIDLSLVAGTSTFYARPGAIAPSSVETKGTARIATAARPNIYCFRFLRTYGGKAPAIGEIVMLREGRPVNKRLYSYIGGSPSSQVAGHDYNALTDESYASWWSATEEDPDPRVRMTTSALRTTLNSYMFATPPDQDAMPCDWDLYGYDGRVWFLLDSRRNETVGVKDGTYAGGRLSKVYRTSEFAGRFERPFGDATVLKLDGDEAFKIRFFAKCGFERFGGVEGVRNLQLGPCSTFLADVVSDWSGAFVQESGVGEDYAAMSRVLVGNGQDLNARVKKENGANITVEAADGTANLLIDDTWPDKESQPQLGRLADGAGTLGIVKRGTSRRVLETQDAGNTGTTSVEAGTLEVRGSRTIDFTWTERKARYFKMTPLSYPSNDSYNYNFGISEIELLDVSGNKIAWPAGTTVTTDSPVVIGNAKGVAGVIDGVTGEKLILLTQWTSGGTYPVNPYPYVRIDAGQIVTYGGWRWWTTEHDNNAGPRIPTGWKLETSFDGVNWTLVDNRPDQGGWVNPTPTSGQPKQPAESRSATLVGPIAETVTTVGGVITNEFDAAFLAPAEGPRATRHPGIRSRYFRFGVSANVNDVLARPAGVTAADDNGGEFAELALFYRGERVAWPKGMTFLGGNETAINAFDGDPATSFSWTASPNTALNIDAGEELVFDEVVLVSGASANSYRRLPAILNFTVSTNRSDWVPFCYGGVDEAAAYDTAPGAKIVIGSTKNRLAMLAKGANDALGDEAPVAISAGATLEINAGYEKFGPLSGAGRLDLHYGATAEANATAATTFPGDIAGVGTFVAGGAEILTLTGLKSFLGTLEVGGTLVLGDTEFVSATNVVLAAGGVLKGNGRFDGDLLVTSAGGALDGELTVDGTLTISGALGVKTPAGAGDVWSRTLFRAKTIPVATREALAAVVHPSDSRLALRFIYSQDGDYTVCTAEAYRRGLLLLVR